MHDVLEFSKEYFFWKSGHYTVHFSVKSPNKVELTESIYTFELNPYEVEDLRKNIPMFKVEAKNIIKKGTKGFEPEEVKWMWASTSLERVERDK